MKVLYVMPGLGRSGGAERSLASMAPHWAGKLDLHVVTLSGQSDLVPEILASGAAVTEIQTGSRASTVRGLISLIRDAKPDLVHSVLFDADIPTRVAATICRVPTSTSLVNVNYGPEHRHMPGRRPWKVSLAHGMDTATAQSVRRFHALTNEVAEVMSRRLHVDRSRIQVIPRGRDRDALGFNSAERRERVRSALGVGDRPLVMAAARHEWQKGLDILLKAVPQIRARYPDVAFLFGGREGQATADLHALARQVGLEPSDVFLGSRDDVPDLLCAADAFCVPSRWEGLGSILVEGMALGATVVAADIPPIREVDPAGQWLNYFTPGDETQLATAVVKALGRQSAPERVTFALERYEAHYRADHVSDRMVDFFQGVGP